jgi:hypothetical protein
MKTCKYCEKELSEVKLESKHGCLDCAHDIRVEKIDHQAKRIAELELRLEEAESIIDYCACKTIYAHAKQKRTAEYMKKNKIKPKYGRDLIKGFNDEA